MPEESWKQIAGTRNRLFVSDRGRVMRLRRGNRQWLVTIRSNGRFTFVHAPGVVDTLNLLEVYKELFGRELEGKPYPVKGRWIK